MLDRIAASPLKSLLSGYRWRILPLSLAWPLSDAWCNKKPLAGLHFPCPESHRTRPERKLLWWQNKGTAHLLFACLLKPVSDSWSLCFEVSASNLLRVNEVSKNHLWGLWWKIRLREIEVPSAFHSWSRDHSRVMILCAQCFRLSSHTTIMGSPAHV